MDQSRDVQVGNAVDDASERGWFVGSFIDKKFGLRHSENVEIRWAVHAAGEARADWAPQAENTTICVLISGQVDFEFRTSDGDKKVSLAREGDFVMWGPGTDHKWQAPVAATTIAIRWKAKSNKSGVLLS